MDSAPEGQRHAKPSTRASFRSGHRRHPLQDVDGTQYHYNWSTKGVAGSFYYKIGVKLDDGQTYYMYISLR